VGVSSFERALRCGFHEDIPGRFKNIGTGERQIKTKSG
jgi:hypothetical protein